MANLFTNPLEVLKTLYAQSHKNNELMVLIDFGRYASLLGHPPSAVIDKLKKHTSAVLAMWGPGMRGKTKVLTYLIFVIFFTRAKFLENKIFTKVNTVNCQFFALNL